MKNRKTENGYALVLERGEELISTLTAFCAEQNISGANFNAIGAVEKVQIGYYDLPKREYFFRNEPGVFEVASMTGNVALAGPDVSVGAGGKPFIHAHAVLSRCDESCATVGGHIKEAYVAVTLEIFMTVLSQPLERALNDDVGLKLLKL